MLQRVAWCGHVVKLYETFKVNSEAHLIMELCAGGTLRDLMQREGGRLPSSTAARVLQALSEFARACLQEGVYHLDIKPDNILLVSPEPDSAIKVGDFGLARGRQQGKSGVIGPGHGTRGYMAPEAEQHGKYSHRSEMYSVGAVLYIMLTGEPHCSFDQGATVYQPLDSSNKHWLSLDPPVRVILARLLDPQPKNRLTADQVLAQPWVYQAQERSCPFYCVGPSYMPPGQANTDDDSLLSKWSVPSSVYESERDMHSSDMASNEDFAESNILPRGQEVPGAVGRSSTSSQPSSKPHSQTASPYADRSNTEAASAALMEEDEQQEADELQGRDVLMEEDEVQEEDELQEEHEQPPGSAHMTGTPSIGKEKSELQQGDKQPVDLWDEDADMADMPHRRILDDAWLPSPVADESGEVTDGTDVMDIITMRARLAELQTKYAQQHEDLECETARRMAAEANLAAITDERDASRADCAQLRSQLNAMQRELHTARHIMDGHQGRVGPEGQFPGQGCEGQASGRPHDAQALHTGMGDVPLGSDAIEQAAGTQAAQRPCTEFVHHAAARAGGNLPLGLPQHAILDGATQADPGSLKKKRKRAAGNDKQAPHLGTGDVHMAHGPMSADKEDSSSSQQPSPKRVRHMGPADPHDQTQDAAVGAEHAGHAEPAGSATHISQPAADTKRYGVRRKAAARKQAEGPVRRSKRLQELNNMGAAL
ncbi:Calcium-dependent protein kinase [Trebouxia sp. C0009 RCD-2024]